MVGRYAACELFLQGVGDYKNALFAAEEYFQNDPEGIYRAMDSDSKRVYRQRLSAAAAKAKKSERDFADAILKKAKEIKEQLIFFFILDLFCLLEIIYSQMIRCIFYLFTLYLILLNL